MRQRDFERNFPEELMPYTSESEAECASVMGWPEDAMSRWVATHRQETEEIICRSAEGKNAGFCETSSSRKIEVVRKELREEILVKRSDF